MSKQLRKSKNRTLSGVCSGIAEFLGWKVAAVRDLFVLLTLFWGSGILLYIILAIMMPYPYNDNGFDIENYR